DRKDTRSLNKDRSQEVDPSLVLVQNYKFQKHNTSFRGKSIAGPSKLPDRRTATTTSGSRMPEVSGRDNQTRQTRATTRRRNEQAEKPVRSRSNQYKETLPIYYLQAVYKEKDRIHEDLNNIEINGIPGSTFRRRSLSMEALNGIQCIGFNSQNQVVLFLYLRGTNK
ncbi:hypothetical protein TNCV_966931, partial [Trichonephila clavipes]